MHTCYNHKSLIQLYFALEVCCCFHCGSCHWRCCITILNFDDFLSFLTERVQWQCYCCCYSVHLAVSLPTAEKKFIHFTCIISNTLEEVMDTHHIFVCMCISAYLLYTRRMCFSLLPLHQLYISNSHMMLQTIASLLRFQKRTLEFETQLEIYFN